ncbi:MAG: hypothetical protein Q9166_001235 [cf. Caloplaca sp. 2 TL-2023]
MSAPLGPRGFRGRATARTRGTFPPRGSRPGHEDLAARKAKVSSGLTNGGTPTQSRPSSRSGATRVPSRPSLYRAQFRQIRNSSTLSTPGSKDDAPRDATTQEQSVYKKHMENTFTKLGELRKQERKNAIRDGFLADPDKPTTLANAITIVGTCQDMCAEYERVQRVVQFMVDDCEKVPHSEESSKVPSEDRMVKRYRRPAAGYEEQLPSDIRPPLILQKTLDYLMNEVVGGPEPLANVHKFVWDRTRAIRNDFSIQQVTKVEELRIAISCFERIARFHILSLHQLAGTSENSVDFDAYQEREQLNNTLLSLIYYYDDSRHKLTSPNEPEFRAYCIIFEIQDQRPDLEDRAQNWPAATLKDQRVKTALKLYAAAASASDSQGPLRPQAPNAIAQANVPLFFNLIQSPAVPYLMACVAEIYFNKVRRMALDTMWKAYKVKKSGTMTIEDWTLGNVMDALGFDDEGQAQTFCEEHGFTVSEKEDGEAYVDLGSVAGRFLSDMNTSRKQAFSTHLVEQKRRGRTLPAAINGLTAAQAQAQGLVVEDYSDNEGSSVNNDDTLFLPNDVGPTKLAENPTTNGIKSSGPRAQEESGEDTPKPSPFFQFKPSAPSFMSSEKPKADTSTVPTFFGKPSITKPSQPSNPFPASQTNELNFTKAGPFSNLNKPESAPTTFSNPNRPDSAPSPFSNLNKPDSAPNRFSIQNKPDAAPLTFDTTKPVTTQTHLNDTSNTSSSRSFLDVNPSSTPVLPKVSFGTSPLFSQDGASQSAQIEKRDPPFNSSSEPSLKGPEPAPDSRESSHSPFNFLRSSAPAVLSSTLLPQAPPTNTAKETTQKDPPPAFSPFFPPSIPSRQSSNSSMKQPNKSATSTTFDFAKPAINTSKPFSFLGNNEAVKPTEQPIVQLAPITSNPIFKSPQLTSTQLQTPNPAVNTPEAAVSTLPPHPRPVVLDALAEGLMMDDQGLLQQFIEYTVGPIVHQAYQEVEDDRSWSRAGEVRTVLLSRKYLRCWKDTVWKRKLLRKGKERRATFAKSMQQMARSSRQRPVLTNSPLQSSLMGTKPRSSIGNNQRSEMGPPSSLQSILKRKSLPTDFEVDGLPNAEAAFSNKRRRQEPPQETQSSKHSLHSPFQPHHKRSKTMGDSRRPQPLYGKLADFSHLDENDYDNEQVLQQARRLIGHTKLDSTRGDYFALKSRGIDPDTPLMPQLGKRSRVDEQIERVRKLLKPSSPATTKSTSQLNQPSPQSNSLSSQAALVNRTPAIPSNSSTTDSPNHLLAQVRQVREALAESTAWFQAEREKSERLSSSRSSAVPPITGTHPQSHPQPQSQDIRPQEWRPTPTRAQIRLEKTKANGLLPPDWDWNKSVTEWRLRGGAGSPRPSASREQSRAPTPVVKQQRKPIGLAAGTNGLGRRPVKIPDEEDEVYNDEEEGSHDDKNLMGGGSEEGGEDDGEDSPEGFEEDDYYDGEGQEDEEGEDVEEEEEEDVSPERAVLQTQGNSADTAIDLD